MNYKNYISFFALLFVCAAHSQIVNQGILKIEASTLVSFVDEYTNTGTHTSEGDLHLNSNFVNNGTTSTPTSGTVFFDSTANDIQTISGTSNTITFYNFTLNNSLSGVSVSDNFELRVVNSLTLTDGDLRLVGDAQLVQTHVGGSANSRTNGFLFKDQQGSNSLFAYNYWASPVNLSGSFSLLGGLFDGTDAAINPFSPQQVGFSADGTGNGSPSVLDGSNNVTTPLTISTDLTYQFLLNNWVKIDQNSTMNPGEGFVMKGTGTTDPTQNYTFKGLPNDGTYSFAATINEYSFLGNPYPSALDIDQFLTDNSGVITQVYFWVDGGSADHSQGGYLGGYATRNLTTGSAAPIAPESVAGVGSATSEPSQFMGVGQGFFTYADATGTISFQNSQRTFKTETNGELLFLRDNDTFDPTKKSIIRLGFEDPQGFHRQIALGFVPNSPADENFNRGYDAFMWQRPVPRINDMFFIIEDMIENKYVIQGVGSYDEDIEIPIGLMVNEDGSHKIMLDNVENFVGTVYLKDNLLNYTHSITDGDFTIERTSQNSVITIVDEYQNPLSGMELSDRYSIVFKAQSTLSDEDFLMDNSALSVYYNGRNHIVIKKRTDISIERVAIYNLLGQKVREVDASELGFTEESTEIPFNKRRGIYFVKVATDYGLKNYKILKQ